MRLEILLSVIAVIVGLILLAWAIWEYINLPTVLMSYNTGDCVRVINIDTAYDCENMPNKFHHTWVE